MAGRRSAEVVGLYVAVDHPVIVRELALAAQDYQTAIPDRLPLCFTRPESVLRSTKLHAAKLRFLSNAES